MVVNACPPWVEKCVTGLSGGRVHFLFRDFGEGLGSGVFTRIGIVLMVRFCESVREAEECECSDVEIRF